MNMMNISTLMHCAPFALCMYCQFIQCVADEKEILFHYYITQYLVPTLYCWSARHWQSVSYLESIHR